MIEIETYHFYIAGWRYTDVSKVLQFILLTLRWFCRSYTLWKVAIECKFDTETFHLCPSRKSGALLARHVFDVLCNL